MQRIILLHEKCLYSEYLLFCRSIKGHTGSWNVPCSHMADKQRAGWPRTLLEDLRTQSHPGAPWAAHGDPLPQLRHQLQIPVPVQALQKHVSVHLIKHLRFYSATSCTFSYSLYGISAIQIMLNAVETVMVRSLMRLSDRLHLFIRLEHNSSWVHVLLHPLVFLFSPGLAVTRSLWTHRGLCVRCVPDSSSCSLHLIHEAPRLSARLWRRTTVRYGRSWLARVMLRWWESSVRTLLARHASARADVCAPLIKPSAPAPNFDSIIHYAGRRVIEIILNQSTSSAIVLNSSAFKDKVNRWMKLSTMPVNAFESYEGRLWFTCCLNVCLFSVFACFNKVFSIYTEINACILIVISFHSEATLIGTLARVLVPTVISLLADDIRSEENG